MLKSDTNEATTVVDDGEPQPTEALPVGFVIGGKYAVKRLLGMGGNGAVYEGEHNTVGHRVAIKVVHRSLADRQDIMARFQREARICGTLRHPHVAQVYDFGALADGAPYMIMELQEGRSLANVLEDTRLPIAAVIHITRQLLDGLGAAHRFGAVHRDVKPDNVMIVRDQSGEVVVKLVDFGISKSIGRRTERSVTLDGVVIGSPDYMSPEQLRSDDIDQRTDIYSTGVLLYEAITGRLPFEHERIVDVVTAIMRDPFPRPSELRPDCPPELERVVLKATSRDAAQRYQSADEMSRALAESQVALRNPSSVNLVYLSERPMTDRMASSQRRRTMDSATLNAIRAQVGGLGRRSRAAWIAIACLSLAVVLAVAGSRMLDGSATSERITTTQLSVPAAAQVTQKRAPDTTQTVPATPATQRPNALPALSAVTPPVTGAGGVLIRSRAPRKVAERDSSRNEMLPRVQGTVNRELANAPPVEAQVLNAKVKQAAAAFAMGQMDQARVLYRQVIAADPANADAWRGLCLASSRLGEHSEAARAFKRYLALRPSAADADRIRQQLDKVQ